MCLEPNNDNNNIRKVSNVYENINYGVISSDVKGEDKKRGRRLEEARKREVARKRKRLQ